MNEIYMKYLSGMRAFVQSTVPEKPERQELGQLMELARVHSTVGILCYVYMSHPELVEPDVRAQLRRHCLGEISLYTRRGEQTRRLSAELDKNGIEHILFKGFVVRDYYPMPELRTFGDVDIIIHKEDRQKSDALLLGLGFERRDDWEPSYSYLRGTEYYELHSRVIDLDVSDKADFIGYYADIWGHTQPAGVVEYPHARELKPEFHFLYLLTHIAKHINSSGAGVRMYLDLAMFIRHFGDSLDWSWVAGELEKLSLTDFANVALTATERWLGVGSPLPLRPVADEVMEDFLEFTLSGGVYGYVGRDKSIVFLKQDGRSGEDVSKVRTLMRHAFPPASILVKKYTYLQKHPWLLPAAWVQRLAGRPREWGRFADHTKNIISADEEKVLKLRRIYQEIGL